MIRVLFYIYSWGCVHWYVAIKYARNWIIVPWITRWNLFFFLCFRWVFLSFFIRQPSLGKVSKLSIYYLYTLVSGCRVQRRVLIKGERRKSAFNYALKIMFRVGGSRGFIMKFRNKTNSASVGCLLFTAPNELFNFHLVVTPPRFQIIRIIAEAREVGG